MILPNKYTDLSKTLIWFGGIILNILGKKNLNIDKCYKKFFDIQKKYNQETSYEDYMKAIIYLYMIGAIEQDGEGGIYNVNFKSKSE